MIYKFQDESGENLQLEVFKDFDSVMIDIKDNTEEKEKWVQVRLNKDNLYDLIGSLHSIQTKIKKEASSD